jgi:hypothetical protein
MSSAKAVSQLLWSHKDREEWFSLGENHQKLFPSVYTNCETAVAFAEWLFGTEGKRRYFFFALSLLLPRVTPFLSRETIHRRRGSSITLRRLV